MKMLQTYFVSIFFIVFAVQASAQGDMAFISRYKTLGSVTGINLDEDTVSVHEAVANELHPRALKDFSRYFQSMTDAHWFKVKGGFVVHCFQEGIRSRIIYSSKGNRICQILSYDAKQLSDIIKADVENIIPGATVNWVDELKTWSNKIYFIYLENEDSFTTLKYAENGDFEIYQVLSKQPRN